MMGREARESRAAAGKAPVTTRRGFLRVASIGAAAAGLLAAAPRVILSREDRPTSPLQSTAGVKAQGAAAPSAPIVAYVRDAAKGEVAIFIGTREIIRRDPELVARLMHATA